MSELVYGIHTVSSLLKNYPERFLCIYILHGRLNIRLQSVLNRSRQYGIPVQYCERNYLNSAVQSVAHQGIVAKIHKVSFLKDEDISKLLKKFNTKKYLLFLILDGITDPRNLGACLRCAGAFGVDVVVASRKRSVGLNGVVRKVASGVADVVPFVRVTNLARTLQFLKKNDIWIVGTVLKNMGKSIFQASLSSRRLAVVMGSEGSGIRFLIKRYCDELVNIPMAMSVTHSLISLNVSVATGICLNEVLRQRLYYGK